MPKKRLLFVSYSREDKHIVGPISELLRAGGVAVFRDETGLHPGDRWSAIITDKLEEAATVFVFWSGNSAQSIPVRDEWTRAIEREINVVPILLDNTPLAEALKQFQWQDMRSATPQSIKQNEDRLKIDFAGWLFGPATSVSELALSSARKVMGLASGYMAEFLESFRWLFDKHLETIPDEKRVRPPLRLGCVVLKEAAYAGDEQFLQEMFAKLLATGCNSDVQHKAHPGFASVISQLIPLEAEILRMFVGPNNPVNGVALLHGHFNRHKDAEKSRQFWT